MGSNGSDIPARVLVVEAERGIAALIAYRLARENYRVSTAHSDDEAIQSVTTERPDLVVLDLALPHTSALDALQELRRAPGLEALPVIFLTAGREEIDRIRGLELGADDYVSKPFSPQELVRRVGSLLHRVRARPADDSGRWLRMGEVEADLDTRRVQVGQRDVGLTPIEYRLLIALMERRGSVQTRKQLLQSAWDVHVDIETRTVDMHVQRLRHKLGTAGDRIETARGFGYRFRDG